MAKDWEEQLRAAWQKQQPKPTSRPEPPQDEATKRQLQKEIVHMDQQQKNLVDEFMRSIGAKDILDTVRRQFFNGKGEIYPIFIIFTMSVEVGTKEVLIGYRQSDGSPAYRTEHVYGPVEHFMAGLELKVAVSDPLYSSGTLCYQQLFIGFLGERKAYERLIQGQTPVSYSYKRFGVALGFERTEIGNPMDGASHGYSVSVEHQMARDLLWYKETRIEIDLISREREIIIQKSDINAKRIYASTPTFSHLFRSQSFQQKAIEVARARILELADSREFTR